MDGLSVGEALENTALRQWFEYGAMLAIAAFGLLRIAGNIRELHRLSRLGQRRAGYYAVRVWGARPGPLRILLTAECLVVNVLCALLILALSEASL